MGKPVLREAVRCGRPQGYNDSGKKRAGGISRRPKQVTVAYQGVLLSTAWVEVSGSGRSTATGGSDTSAIKSGADAAGASTAMVGGATTSPRSVQPTAGTEALASAVIANPAEMSCWGFMTTTITRARRGLCQRSSLCRVGFGRPRHVGTFRTACRSAKRGGDYSGVMPRLFNPVPEGATPASASPTSPGRRE